MGPRRKISVAAVEYRQRQAEEEEAVLKSEQGNKTAAVVDEDTIDENVPSLKASGRRPRLRKQSSTEVTAAYHNVSVCNGWFYSD